ncbi:MAG: hypothetical protein JJU29_07650 [Verrucomicrobia bacterium]|nr:hypothetical protein [Verrucomicrobiota bacterium]
MIVLFSIITFLTLGVLFFGGVRALGFHGGGRRKNLWMAGALGILTVLLLFRPDEEIEAGEDAAAYYNAAQVYLSTGAFHHADKALAELSDAERLLFRYGDDRFMITKDHTLWARDLSMEPVSVFFFPAYSLLLGIPALPGFPYGAFWISSLVAAGVGVLLAGLSRKLTNCPWMGWLTYLLFLAHPAVIWNARALRAEWVASLLVLCGISLWLPRVPGERPGTRWNGFCAGVALRGAVLFHMTAIYVVIPALVAGIILTRRERFWQGWWTGLLLGLALFVMQTLLVTDPYWIVDTLRMPNRRPLALGGLFLLVFFSLLARALHARLQPKPWSGTAMGLLMSLGFLVVVFLTLRFRDEHGQIHFIPQWTAAYISLTDFQGVLRIMSRVWFSVALLGLIPLCLRGPLGRWLFFLLAPASLTIGWVVNYMFETRRMVTFLVPLLLLATVSLLDLVVQAASRRLPVHPAVKRWIPLTGATLATLCLIGVAMRGRMPLYRTWNLKGIHGFYQDLSRKIAPEADFLFAEYTQTAVPIEKMTELPLLPLAWEYRSTGEIREIESVWQRLVAEHPQRRHVFISPFAGSAIPGVAFEPLITSSVRTRTLGRARRDVPRNVRRWTRTLHVNRLLPPGAVAPREPYVREFHGSRLGIQGEANRMGTRPFELHGIPFAANEPLHLGAFSSEMMIFLAFPQGRSPESITVSGAKARHVHLGAYWEGLALTPTGDAMVEMTSSRAGYLVQAFSLAGEEMVPADLSRQTTGDAEVFGMTHLDSQWLRAEASLLAPAHAGTSWGWVFAQHSRSEDQPVTVSIRDHDGTSSGEIHLTAEWKWHPVRLVSPEDATGTFQWLQLNTEPPYDPQLSNFPANLGFRIHRFAVVP